MNWTKKSKAPISENPNPRSEFSTQSPKNCNRPTNKFTDYVSENLEFKRIGEITRSKWIKAQNPKNTEENSKNFTKSKRIQSEKPKEKIENMEYAKG